MQYSFYDTYNTQCALTNFDIGSIYFLHLVSQYDVNAVNTLTLNIAVVLLLFIFTMF